MPKKRGDKSKVVDSLFQNIGRLSPEDIERLSPELQVDLFTKIDINGDNMLMMAIRDHLEAAYTMIYYIEKLPRHLQGEILKQTNNSGENALALANARDVELEEHLLNLIRNQEEGLQEEIWTQANSSIKQTVQETNIFFEKTIDILPENSKENFLIEPTEEGENKLMRIIQHNPIAVMPLLKRIDKLPFDKQRIIFTQLNQAGDNVLTRALQYAPNVINPLLICIKPLDINDIELIMDQVAKKGLINHPLIYPDLTIIRLLAHVKQIGENCRQSDVSTAVMNIHSKLDAEFQEYLKFDISGEQLLQSWKQTLNSGDVDVKAIQSYPGLEVILDELKSVGKSLVDESPDHGFSPAFFRPAVQDDSASEDEEKKEFPPPGME